MLTVANQDEMFLRIAQAQLQKSRKRGRDAYMKLGGAIVWLALFLSGIFPQWFTFTMFLFVGTCATVDWQEAALARKGAAIASLYYKTYDR